MADNYLERRMEEYRLSRQGGAVHHARRASTGLRPGQVAVDYPSMRVLIVDALAPAGEAVIEAFRRFGCRVAITDADRQAGTRLAQKTGAQYHPDGPAAAIDRLAAAGDPVSVVIKLGNTPTIRQQQPLQQQPPTLTPPKNATPPQAAAWCLYAAHPTNLPLWEND